MVCIFSSSINYKIEERWHVTSLEAGGRRRISNSIFTLRADYFIIKISNPRSQIKGIGR
jgi:hypothetical protein